MGSVHLQKLYRAKQCVHCVMLAIIRMRKGAVNATPAGFPSEKEVQEASTVAKKGPLLAHYASPGSTQTPPWRLPVRCVRQGHMLVQF